MVDQLNAKQLAELFRQLGAKEPEQWADSQIEEGIPQLARFLFLKLAWQTVISPNDSSWIEAEIGEAAASSPRMSTGAILARMRAKGILDDEIIELVRQMQYRTMFGLLELLEDPRTDSLGSPIAAEITWALCQIHPDGQTVVGVIDGMHEDALTMDPTGREMRPQA